VEYAWVLPRGLKAPEVPADNPMTAEKVELGHKLFFDKRLSVDGSRSCYSCHQNELGNADGRARALGPGDKLLARNTPTIWNVAYFAESYWDGRAKGLEKQMLGAWKGGNMGVGEAGLAAKAAEIGGLPEYKEAFKRVFAVAEGEAVTPEQVARRCRRTSARCCAAGRRGTRTALEPEPAQRGWELFRGKAACTGLATAATTSSDGLYHRVGVGVPESGEERRQGPLRRQQGGRGQVQVSHADAAQRRQDGAVLPRRQRGQPARRR
jgi:cytochrome c peroxidase